MPLCGGTSDAKAVDEHCRAAVQKVKDDVEKRLNRKVEKYEPVQMKTQVVAGTNYFVKVDTGAEFIHLRIYEDLQHNISLHGVQSGKKVEDSIDYFQE